jgi:hypothetical protein
MAAFVGDGEAYRTKLGAQAVDKNDGSITLTPILAAGPD